MPPQIETLAQFLRKYIFFHIGNTISSKDFTNALYIDRI